MVCIVSYEKKLGLLLQHIYLHTFICTHICTV